MATTAPNTKTRGILVLRLIAAILVIGMSLFKLVLTYRGLDQPAAMDQAQIARNVAIGNGFSTHFLRPIEVMTADSRSGNEGANFDRFKDSNHAPLNIAAIAAALKLTGYSQFEDTRLQDSDNTYIYPADRVVSATSVFFTIVAMFLAYTLIMRLFDDVVACSTITFLMLSDLVLQYSISGLPQPLMLCFLLAGLHAIVSAIDAESHAERVWARIFAALGFISLSLMCLTGWMGIWIALGLFVFCGFYFRPFGSYTVMGLVILGIALLPCALNNNAATGSIMGNAFYSIYNCFGGGEDVLLRSAHADGIPLNNSSFILRLLGYTFGQFSTMYVNVGSIIVAPFFFLALLNQYKKKTVQGAKWAVFSMWGFACIGMALYGITSPINASQLAILFAPFFTAYGISLVFNFIARLKMEGATFNQARGLAIFLMILISAGPFLSTLPKELYMGISLGDKNRPHFPPYYPTALNTSLVEQSNERDIIVTDQPWAVAWYANRHALWLPLRIDDYETFLQPAFNKAGFDVQGFLITPSSHSPNREIADGNPGGMTGIISDTGDFAPLSIEGKLLLMVPRHNLAFADLFMENATKGNHTKPLGELVSSRGEFSNRVPLLGTEIMYYSKTSSKK